MQTKLVLAGIISLMFFGSCETDHLLDMSGNLVPKTVDEDPDLPSALINGVQLHTEAYGPEDGTLLICLHGGPGADYRYLLNCKELADEGYRVVFFDQRGTGLSQRLPEEAYGDDVFEAMQLFYDDILGIITHFRTSPEQKVYILGHSWGGMLGTAFTAHYPDLVEGLVVCEPGGLVWEDIVTYITNSRAFSMWGELMNDATYMDQFLVAEPDDHIMLDYKFGILGANNEITGEDSGLPEGFWRSGAIANKVAFELADVGKPDLSDGIENFHIPVLFIYSELNEAYPDDWAQKIAAPFNEVELFKVPGVGHDMLTKQAGWLIAKPKIIEYLNGL